jgi:hypothetical protein
MAKSRFFRSNLLPRQPKSIDSYQIDGADETERSLVNGFWKTYIFIINIVSQISVFSRSLYVPIQRGKNIGAPATLIQGKTHQNPKTMMSGKSSMSGAF